MSDNRTSQIVLVVPDGPWRDVIDHLASALPNEGVALLATERIPEGRLVRQVFRGTNTRASPTRFDMHPQEIVTALRAIDASGWELGAIAHSHPAGPPVPSPTDLAEAAYPDALMLIASFASGKPVVKAWRLLGAPGNWTPEEVSIRILPERSGSPG